MHRKQTFVPFHAPLPPVQGHAMQSGQTLNCSTHFLPDMNKTDNGLLHTENNANPQLAISTNIAKYLRDTHVQGHITENLAITKKNVENIHA